MVVGDGGRVVAGIRGSMWKYDCVIRLNTVIRIIFACVYFISIFTVGFIFNSSQKTSDG